MKNYSDEKIEKIINAKGRFYFLRLLISILIITVVVLLFKKLTFSYKIMFFILICMFFVNYIIQTKRELKKIRKTITTEEILNNGKTGDIILFKSNQNYDIPDLFIFKIIPTNFTNDIWSNIGVLYRDDKNQEISVWISDDKKMKDNFTKKNKTGVKKLLFLDLVKDYDGIIAHCSLNKEIKNDNFLKKVKPYSKYPFMNIESILGKPNNRRGIGSCKFVAELLKDLGLEVKKEIIAHPLLMVGSSYEPIHILVK